MLLLIDFSDVVCESFSAVRILMTVGTDPMKKLAEQRIIDDDAMQCNNSLHVSIIPEKISLAVIEDKSLINEDKSGETRARRLSLSIFPRDRDDVLLNFKEKVEKCSAHLVTCATQVAVLKDLIIKDLINLNLVVHEPELWQRLVNNFH